MVRKDGMVWYGKMLYTIRRNNCIPRQINLCKQRGHPVHWRLDWAWRDYYLAARSTFDLSPKQQFLENG